VCTLPAKAYDLFSVSEIPQVQINPNDGVLGMLFRTGYYPVPIPQLINLGL